MRFDWRCEGKKRDGSTGREVSISEGEKVVSGMQKVIERLDVNQ